MANPAKRRPFLAGAVTALLLLAVVWAAHSKPEDEAVAFFLVGDTHYLADKVFPDKLDKRSAANNSGLVDTMNKLAGTEIPKTAGGGTVLPARGVIHAGDIIDTGDRAASKLQETEWAAFSRDFGLTGKDGRLTIPTYEVHGNHDSPRGEGLAIKEIVARNKTRPGVSNVSKNGLHYSWDWGNVHFVNLGIVVGQVDGVKRKRRYDPLGSLDFLSSDLAEKVGSSGRPVVITHHIDMIRYSQPLPVDDKKAEGMEWDPADVKGFYDALRGYNVAGILYGHTHNRNVFRWNGTTKASKEGIPIFNVDKSGHYSSKSQGFFYMEVRGNTVTAREYKTADSWQTGTWTPLVWTAPVVKVEK